MVLLFAILLWTPWTVDTLVEEATALHADNRYADAAAKFADAYETSGDPAHLNHAARCYDLADEPALALPLWRRYRALDGPTPAERAYADARIELLAERLAPEAPPPPKPVAAPRAIVLMEERPPEPPPWPAIATTAGGGLAAAIGGVFVASAALRSERTSTTEAYAIGGTLLGVGLASATVGVIWWILD